MRVGAKPRDVAVCGLAAVRAAWAARPDDLLRLLLRRDHEAALADILATLRQRRLPYRLVGDEDLARVAATERHQGVVAIFRARPILDDVAAVAALQRQDRPIALYLDGVGNPHNLGAIARSAAHFGATMLLQRDETGAAGLSAAAHRVAEGGFEALAVARLVRPDVVLRQLRDAGLTLIATAATGRHTIDRLDLRPGVVWLFGEEQRGLDPAIAALATYVGQIPGTGAVESLNVSAAVAVCLAEQARQRRER